MSGKIEKLRTFGAQSARELLFEYFYFLPAVVAFLSYYLLGKMSLSPFFRVRILHTITVLSGSLVLFLCISVDSVDFY